MIDMSQFIAAKSDQLNADDLMDSPRTVTITKVTAQPDAAEQPVAIHYESGEGRPFKPCKTMRRVMVAVWGKDASKYVGRSMTLYRDPNVQFGGMQVGGIRISHMSDITEKKTVALLVTRGRKAPYTVQPLTAAPVEDAAQKWSSAFIAKLDTLETVEKVDAFESEKAAKLAELQSARPDLHKNVTLAIAQRKVALAPSASSFDDDDLASAGPDDEPSPDTNDADPIAPTLAKIANAVSLREVDAIDKDTEADRTFLAEAQIDRLDEALATKRAELRETEAKQTEAAK